MTQAEAIWYFSLPEKIRRQHFTLAEQIIYRAKCDIALLNADHKVLERFWEYQSAQSRARHTIDPLAMVLADSRPSSFYAVPAREVVEEMVDEEEQQPRDDKKQVNNASAEPDESNGVAPSSVFVRNDSAVSTTLLKHENTKLRAMNFLRSPSIASTTSPASFFWCSPTTTSGRGMEITPVSAVTDTSLEITRLSSSSTLDLPREIFSPLSIAKPLRDISYQVPEAKPMLRQSLSSLASFDQALVLGFPTDSLADAAPYLEAVSAFQLDTDEGERQCTIDALGIVSPIEVDDGDDQAEDGSSDEDDYADHPRTPCNQTQFLPLNGERLSNKASVVTLTAPGKASVVTLTNPNRARKSLNHQLFDDLQGREVTVRMTLTRPELRESEEELYGWQAEHNKAITAYNHLQRRDPLALESLVFTDDTTGMRGVFARSGSKYKGIRSLWKTIGIST